MKGTILGDHDQIPNQQLTSLFVVYCFFLLVGWTYLILGIHLPMCKSFQKPWYLQVGVVCWKDNLQYIESTIRCSWSIQAPKQRDQNKPTKTLQAHRSTREHNWLRAVNNCGGRELLQWTICKEFIESSCPKSLDSPYRPIWGRRSHKPVLSPPKTKQKH